MVSVSDVLHLPYTHDLTEGGIAYALHSLPYTFQRLNHSSYDRLRRVVAGTAVQLAFRRYLTERHIPFDVKSALPFTEHDRYDVTLGGRRCEIKSFLLSHPEQISQIQRDPQVLLRAPALVASDQHAGDGHSHNDLYLFAFLPGTVAASQHDLQKVIDAQQPYSLVHVMPDAWNRPPKWNPLGKLVLKSESGQAQIVEIGGQGEGREMRSQIVELPPRARVELSSGFFSLSYVHTRSALKARLGIRSPIRRETYVIGPSDWGNIWVYGLEVLMAGYRSRAEFSRSASFVQAGTSVFQVPAIQVKNLAEPVSELKPLSDLFERLKDRSIL